MKMNFCLSLLLGGLLVSALAGRNAAASEPWTLTSPEQENKLGEDTYKEILKQEKVCKDPVINAFVRKVADRILPVAPDKGFKYEVVVLESDKVNAFCLPGGKIAVYTAILPYCQSEAGLAAVMGHEVAHAILRHGGQRMTQQTVVGVVGAGLEKVLEASEAGELASKAALGAYGYGAQLGILLPYSRGHETEADVAGLEYMAKAGYDPREAPRFWERFSELKSEVPSFLSTHPSHDDRARRLTELQPKVQGLYEKSAKLGTGEKVPAPYFREFAPPKGAPAAGQAAGKPAPQPLRKLSEAEAAGAVRKLQSLAARNALRALKREDGFLQDEGVRLGIPAALEPLAEAARKAGKADRVQELLETLNRAAESGVKGGETVLLEALASHDLGKATDLLTGAKDAATERFRQAAQERLVRDLTPIFEDRVVKCGTRQALRKLEKRSGGAGKEPATSFDLTAYVLRQALAGFYKKMAAVEARVRNRSDDEQDPELKGIWGNR